MANEATQHFILAHRTDDVRRLALMAHGAVGVDLAYALDQIQGWQTARRKLPQWAATGGVVYPPHLNMEQCSSEQTAVYKRQVLARMLGGRDVEATLVDLTGGFGVDFFYLSDGFSRALYCERDERLAALVRHNMDVLGRAAADVRCADSAQVLDGLPLVAPSDPPTVIYLDPARRGAQGQKVFGLTDCEPDVTLLRDRLLDRSHILMLKLSPMLDWHEALRQLRPGGEGCEVHIVSVANECKELLLVVGRESHPLRVCCVNDDERFCYTPSSPSVAPVASALEGFLLVPNASIMKAGCFAELATACSLCVVDPNSHLFVANGPVDGFPGRQFRIVHRSSMNRHELREALQGVAQANIATRNFPLSPAELRKRLKLRDGGSLYIFATTWQGRHVLLLCERA